MTSLIFSLKASVPSLLCLEAFEILRQANRNAKIQEHDQKFQDHFDKLASTASCAVTDDQITFNPTSSMSLSCLGSSGCWPMHSVL
jgi:hypothetical protein